MRQQGSISPKVLVAIILAVGVLSWLVFRLVSDEPEPKPPAPPPTTTQKVDPTSEQPKEKPPEIKTTKPTPPDTGSAPTPRGARGEPTEIAGFVRDMNGSPIADATVQVIVYDLDEANATRPLLERMRNSVKDQTATAADGSYKFKNLKPGETHFLRAIAPGFLSQLKDTVASGLLVDFTLRQGARIEGRILDAVTSAPVAGAKIKAWYRTPNSVVDVNRVFRWEEIVTSKDDGSFVYEGAPAEDLLFIYWHDECEDGRDTQTIRLGQTNRIELRIKRGITLQGLVTNKLDGKPVPNATIRVSTVFIPRRTVKTDAEGRFVVAGVERQKQSFALTAPGFSDTREVKDITDADQFDDAKKNFVEFRMEPCGGAAGRVLSIDGQPVDNALVYVALQNPLTSTVRGAAPEFVTKTDGRFLVGNLNANATYRIAAYKEGQSIGVSDPIVVGPLEIKEDADIRLRRGAVISGVVSNEANLPIANAVVTVEVPPYPEVWFPPGNSIGQGSTKTIVTGPDGRYALDGVWRGQFKFSVEHPEHVPLLQQSVTVREPEQQLSQDFMLRIGRFISGSVVGADGQPAEGATVTATQMWSDRVESQATVDKNGNYRLSGIVKGQYRVQARKEGFSSRAMTDVPADANNVSFTLVEAGSILGAVLAPDGRPANDFVVTLSVEEPGPNGKTVRRRPRPIPVNDEGGRFLIDGVDPGVYTVVAASPLYGRVTREGVSVPGGSPVDLGTLALPRGATIRGHIADVAGMPIPDVLITVTNMTVVQKMQEEGKPLPPPGKEGVASGDDSADGGKTVDGGGGSGEDQYHWTSRTDGAGNYSLTGLSPGNYTVKVQPTRHVPPQDEAVSLADGQEAVRNYQLPRGATVTITVSDDFGAQLAAASAAVREADTGRRVTESGPPARSDGQGRLAVQNLRPGKYIIRVDRSGYISRELQVEITEGQDQNLPIVLQKI